MNILYIQSNIPFQAEITEAFSQLNYTLTYQSPPPANETEATLYLQSFLANVKKSSPSFVFSLGFYPFISFACGAVGLPYVSWLVDGFCPNYYSSAIRNEWNYLFTIDSSLCLTLSQMGVRHVHFLPLGIPTAPHKEANITETNDKFAADISMIGTIFSRKSLPDDILSAESPLQNATKGYLEGCVACQYQLYHLPSIGSSLSDTIWEDLTNTYPQNGRSDLEDNLTYYDYRYFNPLITINDRKIHLKNLASCNTYSKIHLFSKDTSNFISTKIENCGYADWNNEIPLIVQQSKVNLVIAHRDYKTAIPPIAWTTIAHKGFLLGNFQEDYSILTPAKPILFHTEVELQKHAAYYYAHEDERVSISNELYQEAICNHTYQHRIREIIHYLFN